MIKQILLNAHGLLYFMSKIKLLNKQNKESVQLLSTLEEKQTKPKTYGQEYFIFHNFQPEAPVERKFFVSLKKKQLKNYCLKIVIERDQPYSGINLALFENIPKEVYFSKLTKDEEEIVLLSLREKHGIAVFVKEKKVVKNDSIKYKTVFYYTMLDSINEIDYQVIDRLPLLIKGEDAALHDSLDLNFDTNKRQLHFMNAGEWLNLYPVETLKDQIIKHRTMLAEYCLKNALIFCYSTEYKYNKKTRKYDEIFNSITPKLGFIKQSFFNEWKSGSAFSYQGESNNHIFDVYKVTNAEDPNHYTIEYILKL